MEKYEALEIKVITFETEDIITGSGDTHLPWVG